VERRLTAILAADVVGYSRLMSQDEAGTLASLKGHLFELIHGKIAEHHGRLVKLTGDGMLVEFGSVVNAVACAADIQRGMEKRNTTVPEDRRIRFRIGINIGDVIVEGDDLFGDGVNVASRLEGIAEPGGIAISSSVRDHIGNRLDLVFEDRGEQALKNIDRPVRVFSVRLGGTERAGPVVAASNGRKRDLPSIAVLPFINMSDDPEQEYFSDGITEDIITDLSKLSGLYVAARNSAFTYKGKPMKVEEVCRGLRVAYVLEGSVRKAGRRIRVTSQLIDGKDGGHLWADRYDRDLTDIFAIQDEITKTIVDQLKVKLLPEEKKPAPPPTENVEAYTYYLRGRQFLHRNSKSYAQLARRMFAKAVELDPLYARAYAGIADCDSFLFLHYDLDVSLDDILATSAKALALDEGLAEAHASRGFALGNSSRFAEAEAAFERALALDPNLFEANFFYARTCVMQGQLEKAAHYFERAVEVKPDECKAPVVAVSVYRSLGREADMMRMARIGAERAERELTERPESASPAYFGANALAVLGERERAKDWARRALALDPDDVLTLYNVACVYAIMGETETALDLLEQSFPPTTKSNSSAAQLAAWLENDSDFAAMRGNPAYLRLMQRLRPSRVTPADQGAAASSPAE
jgi:adenylate cyclase